VDRLLHRYYTDDGEGDGWLVLSAASEQFDFGFGPPPAHRSRLWNVFSPLFNGRKTVREKLLRLADDLKQLDALDYEAARRLMSSRTQSARAASVLDGPLIHKTQGIDEYSFDVVFGRVAQQRALVVMLGLSAYKHDLQKYPDTLDSLTPEYLAEVPLDAFTQEPFVYERVSDADYRLGPIVPLTTWMYYERWMSEYGYRPDSYVPQRSPQKP
jgi:hypothetical protein